MSVANFGSECVPVGGARSEPFGAPAVRSSQPSTPRAPSFASPLRPAHAPLPPPSHRRSEIKRTGRALFSAPSSEAKGSIYGGDDDDFAPAAPAGGRKHAPGAFARNRNGKRNRPPAEGARPSRPPSVGGRVGLRASSLTNSPPSARLHLAGQGQSQITSFAGLDASAYPLARPPPLHGFEDSPRLAARRKNSKFDVGTAKVGQGGFDAEKSRADYETSQAVAAMMKARQLGGAGNFMTHDDQ